MQKILAGFSRKDLLYLLALLLAVGVYSVYFLSFTLFDGFTTLINDAASYTILARKWSPFFTPTLAELNSWPAQTYPPGFPWVLAFTGASESLYASHLLVSLCMLLSIVLMGWIAYRKLGWQLGGLLTLAYCLLPGVILYSMGILSENLYLLLSLAVLMLYPVIRDREQASLPLFLLLGVLLSLAILTRTIGIALIAAVAFVAVFDTALSLKKKAGFLVVAVLSVMAWQLWNVVDPQSQDTTYLYYLSESYGKAGSELENWTSNFWRLLKRNLVQLPTAFNQYLTISHANVWFFLFSYLLFIVSLVCMALRLYQRKLDAVYLGGYLLIVIFWPYASELTRFLHPIVFLLLLQPALYFTEVARKQEKALLRHAVTATMLVIVVNSAFIHSLLIERRGLALENQPTVVHAHEYYNWPSLDFAEFVALKFTRNMSFMASVSGHIPEGSVIAATKATFLTVLSDREAFNLSVIVPYPQQLCNFKLKDVDAVFVSDLKNYFNQQGLGLLQHFGDLATEVIPVGMAENPAFLMMLDKEKILAGSAEEGFDCRSYKEAPPRPD